MDVYSSVDSIKGVGKKTKEMFEKCGIYSVLDLLLYFPRDYEKINYVQDNSIVIGEKNIIKLQVAKIERDIRKGTKLITTVVFDNGINILYGKWFNQPYMRRKFKIGEQYILEGKIDKFNGKVYITNPKVLSENNISRSLVESKYPLKGDVTNSIFVKFISSVLKDITIEENLPTSIISKYGFCNLDTAIKTIHNPGDMDKLKYAIERLKFQELFTYCLKINMIKEYVNKNNEGISFRQSPKLKYLREKLPFELTEAQNRVVKEVLIDQNKTSPMNRLVQGDVGSGKTIVAIIAMFNVVKNGYQAAMMAPTEILAQQHFIESCNLLKDFNIRIELLTSSIGKRNKEEIKKRLVQGEIDIIIGTHALIQDDVEFNNIGLIVTDEQHRFGVIQRNKLNNKGENIDILVMSATPIPRTLSLVMYGDLDVSIINQLPPGRKKIDTYAVTKDYRERVYKFALKEIEEGRQVYIVCPLVEKNENLDITSVESLYEELKRTYFKNINTAVLYGKMNNNDKEAVMVQFKEAAIKVLICTTVVEVGVNVPNATLMIIENAERYGLSQLHQLRGRVGRGSYKSYCILLADARSSKIKKRMDIIKSSNDGFYIAEEDLKIRGSGEVFGFKQHGDNGFILSDAIEDIEILKKANKEARELFCSKDFNDVKLKKYMMKKIEESSKYICFN